ncbi:hypothetical protein ACP49_05745 [Clostridium botulinum]|uniref:hypothetical protein n=1 Tax=Clostridium botulinum TaxID=1491 RepID=UPI0005F8F89D|nr:hypothetical protein [Clostridium botulinum]KOM98653.1 hypothetical protein ACP53_02580 [Clostridium botulinum]KON00099.1 hypothetical protein ACP49_05745 [Clostridium botulinum]MBY7002865.1 hypothetical protein [Clostridium botulinum]MCR1146680.1 hypothetical protein [Clostridium botulinum]NFH92449.1 hypothetical protein [Clostridium botulinum]
MTEKLFHGYNCFSAALGQHFLNTNQIKAIDSILIRWTFDFNKQALFDEVWSVGACVEATDYLLQYDLYNMEGVKVTTHKSTMEEATKILSEEVEKLGSHMIMVDFFFMKSIEWDKARRFGYYPKHLPHFVTVTKETETDVAYQDPLYRFAGNMSKQDLIKARSSIDCFMDIDFEYYKIEDIGVQKNYTRKDKIFNQFYRFINNGQIDMIEKFGSALKDVKGKMTITQDFNWIFNVYLALQSVIDMRQNFVGILEKENIELREELLPLLLKWVSARLDFLNMYREKDITNIQNSIDKIFYLREQEEKFAKAVLKRVE